jgi:hypothetical protein
VDQTVKLAVISNSNCQNPAVLVERFGFNAGGSDSLDNGDLGTHNNLPGNSDYAYPFSVTPDNGVIVDYDNRAQVDRFRSIDMGFLTKLSATISVTAYLDPIDSASGINSVFIQRISTGETWPLLNDTATFTISSNMNFNVDFRLLVGTWITKTVNNESCYQSADGKVTLINPNCTSWKVDVYDSNGLLSSQNVNQSSITILGLASGTYTFVSKVGTAVVDSSAATISGPASMHPAFTTDLVCPSVFDLITFTSSLSGMQSYDWDFGDDNYSTSDTTVHSYSQTGDFYVTVTSATGCQESITDTISIGGLITLANNHLIGPAHPSSSSSTNSAYRTNAHTGVSFGGAQGKISIRSESEMTNTMISVLSMDGKQIGAQLMNENFTEVTVPQTGIYIIIIRYEDGTTESGKVMISE